MPETKQDKVRYVTLEESGIAPQQLVPLYMEAYADMPEYGEPSPEDALRYLQWLKDHHTLFEIALDEKGKPIGFVVADANWFSRFGRGGHIHEWVVHPVYRHKGIGKKLFDDAVEHLRQFHDRIILWAGEHNDRARRFYEQYGFHPEGRYKQWVRWVLELQKPPK
ncbi:MAG: GNAT family N-acetyltransferase [Chlorobi bacterium]|nr:GNAT family N-acetyltransferase [Chlorobiota bacterium]